MKKLEFDEQFSQLAGSLRQEAAIVHELREALVQQRASLAADDPGAVRDSADAIGRVLMTLKELRLSRSTLLASLTGDPKTPLDQLASHCGCTLPTPLEQAKIELRRAAEEVARQVAINGAVLRRAVENGEAFLQTLFSSGEDRKAVYAAPREKTSAEPRRGVLFNRVV